MYARHFTFIQILQIAFLMISKVVVSIKIDGFDKFRDCPSVNISSINNAKQQFFELLSLYVIVNDNKQK